MSKELLQKFEEFQKSQFDRSGAWLLKSESYDYFGDHKAPYDNVYMNAQWHLFCHLLNKKINIVEETKPSIDIQEVIILVNRISNESWSEGYGDALGNETFEQSQKIDSINQSLINYIQERI